MKAFIRLVVVAALFAACIGSETSRADFEGPVGDGWHSWRTAAVDGSDLEVFASIKSGKPTEIRVRSKSVCWDNFAVHAQELGRVDTDQSISWLQRYIVPGSDLSSDVLMAISLHAGERPVTILANILTSASDHKLREEALFWLAQSDSDAAFDILDRLLSENN